MLDAVPLDLADDVIAELSAAAFWHLAIPARMAWLLQPLDTHTFVGCDGVSEQHFQDEAATAMDGDMAVRMASLVVGAIRHALHCFRWRDACWSNGFSRGQPSASSCIKQHLEYDELPA